VAARQDQGVASKPSRGSKESCTPPSVDARLAAIAARQHGLVTSAQFAGAGLGYAAVSNRVATGRLHRYHRGVYGLGHRPVSREAAWMAAVLACGAGAVLSHLSAAVLWSIWRRRVTGIDVLAPRGRRGAPGVRVHDCRRLDRRDITTREHIPTTTVARTLVDLTDILTPHQLANAIHEAAFRHRFNANATRSAMQRANGRRHLHRLEDALALNAAGSAGTRNGLEDRFLSLTAQLGLPPPLVNTQVHEIEVDFHWPDRGLCVEVDGGGHARPRTQREDHERDGTFERAGYRVLRLAEHELDLATVVARLGSA
jgi:hypothetical protein